MSNKNNTPFGDFEIKCKKCGSSNIDIEDSRGWSEVSGSWGGIDIVCIDCQNRTEIMDNTDW